MKHNTNIGFTFEENIFLSILVRKVSFAWGEEGERKDVFVLFLLAAVHTNCFTFTKELRPEILNFG